MITQPQFRDLFEVSGQRLFFNHAAYSPFSRPVVQAMNDYLDYRLQGSPQTWPAAVERREHLRANYARLVGSVPNRIAMMANTVTGLNVLASGLDWQAGDHMLLYSDEFPSNVMPFLNLRSRGVEVEFVKSADARVTTELFEAAIKPATRLISVSSVQYLTGYQADLTTLAQLCHAHNILLSVDAIQSVGVLPTDVVALGIDFLAAGGHKWLMSPLGTGFIYVTEALQERLRPAYRGYMGHVSPESFGDFEQALSPDARRFELGAFNAPGIAGAEKATELLLACDPASIFRHVRSLLDQFVWGLEETGFVTVYDFVESESSGIQLFSHQDAKLNQQVFEYLTAAGVNLALRGRGLRLAPHYHNNADEIEQLLALLRAFNSSQ